MWTHCFSLPFHGGWRGGGRRRLSSNFGADRPPPARSPQGGGVTLEIGFGGGEHLVAQATAHPEQRFIGVEPFINGVASCLRHVEEANVQNIRLHQGDARDVIARLPDAVA